MSLLVYEDLRVDYADVTAVSAFSLTLDAGSAVALVGGSGAGKSTVAIAALGLLPPTATVSGRVMVDGADVVRMPEVARPRLRGWRVALMAQTPGAAFNPAMRVGEQVVEAVAVRRGLRRAARRSLAAARLAEVGLDAGQADRWPHQLSGGQLRRAALAMALATDPGLLIADEPTAHLDTLRQAEVVRLLGRLRQQRGLAVLLITHDVRLARALCEVVAVMHAGRLVDRGPVRGFRPEHPHARALWTAAGGSVEGPAEGDGGASA